MADINNIENEVDPSTEAEQPIATEQSVEVNQTAEAEQPAETTSVNEETPAQAEEAAQAEQPAQVEEPVQAEEVAKAEEAAKAEKAAKEKAKQQADKKKAQMKTNAVMIVGTTLCVVLYVATLLCYLFGTITYNGSALQIFSAIQLIMEIPNIASGFWYSVLAGVAISVLYIVGLIVAIKKLVVLIQNAPVAISAKYTDHTRATYLKVVKSDMFSFFTLALITQMISNILTTNSFSSTFILISVIGAVVYVAEEVCDYFTYREGFDVQEFIMVIIKSALIVTAALLCLNAVNRAVFDDFMTGMTLLFNGSLYSDTAAVTSVYNFYHYVLLYPLFIVLAIMMMYVCYHAFKRNNYFYEQNSTAFSRAVVSQLIYIAVIAIIDVSVEVVYRQGFSWNIFTTEYFLTYIKTACLLFAIFFAIDPLALKTKAKATTPATLKKELKAA